MNDLYDALRNLVKLFERRSIPYALMGGFAVRAYAFPRNTGDLDFTIAVAEHELPVLIADLRNLSFTVPESYETGWCDRVSGMQFIKARLYLKGRGIDADLFFADLRLETPDDVTNAHNSQAFGDVTVLSAAKLPSHSGDLLTTARAPGRRRDDPLR